MNNTLDISQIQRMSIDQIINLYRNGYRLSENIDIKSLSICPTMVARGSTKDIRVTVTSPGTPPYTFKLQRDGAEIYSYTGGPTEISKIWPHKFDEALGTYTYKGFVIDSCPGEPKPSNIDSCVVTIQKEAPTGASPIFIVGALGLVVLAISTSK